MTTPLRGVAAAPGVARARIWRLPERSSEDASSGSGMGLEEAAERAADVGDVAARIVRILRGEQPPRLEERSIAVALDLPPSITAELDPALLAGVALEAGSRTAHAAILSRALGIPAVVGARGLLEAAKDAAEIAVDGNTGEVF